MVVRMKERSRERDKFGKLHSSDVHEPTVHSPAHGPKRSQVVSAPMFGLKSLRMKTSVAKLVAKHSITRRSVKVGGLMIEI